MKIVSVEDKLKGAGVTKVGTLMLNETDDPAAIF